MLVTFFLVDWYRTVQWEPLRFYGLLSVVARGTRNSPFELTAWVEATRIDAQVNACAALCQLVGSTANCQLSGPAAMCTSAEEPNPCHHLPALQVFTAPDKTPAQSASDLEHTHKDLVFTKVSSSYTIPPHLMLAR